MDGHVGRGGTESLTTFGTAFLVDLHNSGFKSLVSGRILKNQRHSVKVEALNYLKLVYFVPIAFP